MTHRRRTAWLPRGGVSAAAALVLAVSCGGADATASASDAEACRVARSAQAEIKKASAAGPELEPVLRRLMDEVATAAAAADDVRIRNAAGRVRNASELLSKALATDDVLVRCDKLLPRR